MTTNRAVAIVRYSENGHAGPGWYFWDDEYPEEGSCGAYATQEEAEAEAHRAEMVLEREGRE